MWHAGQMPPLICGRAEVREEVRELLLGSSVFVWVFFFLQGSLSLSQSLRGPMNSCWSSILECFGAQNPRVFAGFRRGKVTVLKRMTGMLSGRNITRVND